MLKLKLQYFGHLMQRVDSLEKTVMLGGIRAGGEGVDRRCPGDTRLLGKTVQTEIFQQRGGAVKALSPRARPFFDRQVGQN